MASQDTLDQNNVTLGHVLKVLGDFRLEVQQSIGGLREELHQSIGDLRREMNERFAGIDDRLGIIDADLEQIKQSQFSFDVRLERVQAMAHDALNIGHDLKADVKIMNAEVRAWAADVADLQQQGQPLTP